jgi:hypothetical protein
MKKVFRYSCIFIGCSMLFACEEGADMTGPQFEAIGPSVETPTTPETEAPTETVVSTDEDCLSNESFYIKKLYKPLLDAVCSDCHSGFGSAKDTSFVLLPPEAPEANQRNFERFQDLARLDYDGQPLIVEKPLGRANHGGGRILREDEPVVADLIAMIERVRSGQDQVCPEPEDEDDTYFQGMRLMGPQQTLRRALLDLSGEAPTLEDKEMVADHGWAGVEQALSVAMRTQAFGSRIGEMFNDFLLTDKYLGGEEALELLDTDAWPNAMWMTSGNAVEFADGDLGLVHRARAFSNDAVAREPLKLVEYLVMNDRPFTEILTADYMMVSPYSALIYGAEIDGEWVDPFNPYEFKPARVAGIPHAGLLTSPMFLNRFPTTETNRNRHRAKIVYDFFLGVDILKFAQRPIDPTSTEHVPTMRDPQCNVCHNVIDPVAGAFQNWDTAGTYLVPEGWYGDMIPPGFGYDKIPLENRPNGLQWLGRQLTNDPRFDLAMVRLIYRGLTGDEPIEPPKGTEANFAALEQAYKVQHRYFEKTAKAFRLNGHRLKWLIRWLVQSPYYRIENIEPDMAAQAENYEGLGLSLLLTPEQLNRKVTALFGRPWRSSVGAPDYLTSTSNYLFFYGGIDSDDVVKRIREPSGIIASVQQRMAIEGACLFVTEDFSKSMEDRTLFPHVESSFIPEDENGYAIGEVQTKVMDNIKHLHEHILGESLEDGDEELDATYSLFIEVMRAGKVLVDDGLEPTALPGQCQKTSDYWTGEPLPAERHVTTDENYMIRSWMSVVTYLMLDNRFVYP